jgi:hypothetical protein
LLEAYFALPNLISETIGLVIQHTRLEIEWLENRFWDSFGLNLIRGILQHD